MSVDSTGTTPASIPQHKPKNPLKLTHLVLPQSNSTMDNNNNGGHHKKGLDNNSVQSTFAVNFVDEINT
jgi:hypothetical protein